MKRGEVWWVDFHPSIGCEIKKRRPAVIVSNDLSNHFLNRVQVVPLASQTENLYPSECYVEFEGKRSKAMADQIMTVGKKCLLKKLGKVSVNNLRGIAKAIARQLKL